MAPTKKRSDRGRGDNTRLSKHKDKLGNTGEQVYTAKDVILVLGDGDFTFSQGLVAHRCAGKGIVATSYDSESRVKSKYSNAKDCIAAIRRAKGIVLHDVDATKLDETLPKGPVNGTTLPPHFQYIIFNFPHSGQQRVHINRALLQDFFESARSKLVRNGEAHVTLKTRPPYSNWHVEEQAKSAGFVLKERRKFNIRLFPGYQHRTTDPHAKTFEPDLCVTYVFIVNRSKYPYVPPPQLEADEDDEIAEKPAPAVVRPSPKAPKAQTPPKPRTRITHRQSLQRVQWLRWLQREYRWTPLHRRSLHRATSRICTTGK